MELAEGEHVRGPQHPLDPQQRPPHAKAPEGNLQAGGGWGRIVTRKACSTRATAASAAVRCLPTLLHLILLLLVKRSNLERGR